MRKLRIVKKTKNEVTIKIFGGQFETMTWENFNKLYNIVDTYWAVPNESYTKELNEIDKMINDLCVAIVFSEANGVDDYTRLTYTFQIGDLTQKIQEKSGLTTGQIVKITKQRLAMVGYGKKQHTTNAESIPLTEVKSVTFGDLPELQKLKEKMLDENN